jgi:hypothetical protein
MNTKKLFLVTGIIIATLLISNHFLKASDDNKSFLGCWALTLPGNVPGWIEIRQENGYLDGDILWGWGSVVPLANVYIDNDQLVATRVREVVRERDDDGKPVRTQMVTSRMVFSVSGDQLSGTIYTPENDGTGISEGSVSGKKNPPLPAPPNFKEIEFGEKMSLFNGKDLAGWRMVNPNSANGFYVKDGILINNPVQEKDKPHISYGNLRTEQEFEDFNLILEVNVPENGNSGVYLRGIYEVQVFDSYGKPLDSHNMGGLYSRITPSENAEKPSGEWQTMDITLCQRHLTVILNGVTIINNQPVKGITGGALTSNEFAPGPIYLQGDHDKVMYRNIFVTPIID